MDSVEFRLDDGDLTKEDLVKVGMDQTNIILKVNDLKMCVIMMF